MLDDIRPSMPQNQGDQNKNASDSQPAQTIAQEAILPSPPVRPYAAINQSAQTTANREPGFTVLPQNLYGGKNPFKKIIHGWNNTSKKKKIIILTVLILVFSGGGAGAYFFFHGKSTAPAPATQAAAPVPPPEPPKPTTEASKLTGVQVSPELNKRPVTSIQIENSPDARPQSGLLQAGVVFEAIAEGGITRFNASFMEAQPDYIGPIRSVRPYYAVLAAPFDPIFVHAGGSADGLAAIRNLGLKDMDHGANGAAFKRVSDRYAPHNLYSSTADLDKASAGRGYTTSNVKSLLRKEEKKGLPPAASTINLTISSPLYNVIYNYDAASNTYKRTMGGKPHTDHRSGEQIAPKTVVALVAGYSQNGIYSVYQVTGSNTAFIFQDGQVQQVTWTKPSEKEQFSFKDANGQPVGLNPGQTWFTLVKNPGQVTYTP